MEGTLGIKSGLHPTRETPEPAVTFKLKTRNLQSTMENLRVPIPDEIGFLAKTWFSEFLKSYKYDGDSETLTAQQKFVLFMHLFDQLSLSAAHSLFLARLTHNYMEQIEVMMLNDKSTLYINFAHIAEVSTQHIIQRSLFRRQFFLTRIYPISFVFTSSFHVSGGSGPGRGHRARLPSVRALFKARPAGDCG